ncbi:MAG: hypothetical protein JNK53_05650 [Phycisphaerae bacterium]|nr:hypothetical protein [Phycisphaerae bacterium]
MTTKQGDDELPRPEDIVPGVLHELQRRARALRRVVERAMQPKFPDNESTNEDSGTGTPQKPSPELPPRKVRNDADDDR